VLEQPAALHIDEPLPGIGRRRRHVRAERVGLALGAEEVELIGRRQQRARALELVEHTREELGEDKQPARQQGVKVLALRHAGPWTRTLGCGIALEHRDALEVVRKDPARHQASHAAAQHHRMFERLAFHQLSICSAIGLGRATSRDATPSPARGSSLEP
jgi:hypothetical protein